MIGGDVDCGNAIFENAGGYALVCDGAIGSGRLLLHLGFSAVGKVALIGTQIGGDCLRAGSTFENGGWEALACDNANIRGAFYLRQVKRMGGGVNLSSDPCRHPVR